MIGESIRMMLPSPLNFFDQRYITEMKNLFTFYDFLKLTNFYESEY